MPLSKRWDASAERFSFNMMMKSWTVQTYDRPEDVPRDSWAPLVDATDGWRDDYLGQLPHAGLACPWHYFVVRKGLKSYAFTFGYTMAVGLATVMLLGSPVNTGWPVFVRNDAPDVTQWWPLLLAEIEGCARRMADAVIVRDLWHNGPSSMFEPILFQQGYTRRETFYESWLSLTWPSFEAYWDALRSKIPIAWNHDLRLLDQAGYTWTTLPPELVAASAPHFAKLWRAVYDRHQDPDQSILPAAYFQRFGSLSHCCVLGLTHGPTVVGFAYLFSHGSWLEASYCGVDYAYAAGKPVQRSLVMAIVQWAFTHHYEAVNLGISNELVKARTGSHFRPLYAYLKGLTDNSLELWNRFWTELPEVPAIRVFHGERPR